MAYDGKVCYMDGWHHSVVTDDDGNDHPDEKLVLEDDGTYRPATDADVLSWHDRKHAATAPVILDDGAKQMAVTADEMEAVAELLAERRAG